MPTSTETLTFSNLYPNRPIRPLPKRRLRERLSPEVAESIRYPPSTRPASIFYPPYPPDIPEEECGRNETTAEGGNNYESGDEVRQFVGLSRGRQSGTQQEGGEGDWGARSATVPRSHPEMSHAFTGPRQTLKANQTRHANPLPPTTDLSADGYESFENTNNKKKRKIPTAGDSSLGASHSLADGSTLPASAGLATAHSQGDGTGSPQYAALNGTSANNKGISGAGRGMFGRARNGRSPLRSLNNANNWTERNSKLRPGRQWASPSGKHGVSALFARISFALPWKGCQHPFKRKRAHPFSPGGISKLEHHVQLSICPPLQSTLNSQFPPYPCPLA
jgi:hypothetical protein